ncbi:MAG: hypothetical protein HYW34_02465 [Candidatus Brennerbacteria bacterium]|nr:hypothetical protein [Candidatus Brennerbacteria bacterium]
MDNHKDNHKKIIERLKNAAKDLEKKGKKYLRSSAGKKLLQEAVDTKYNWKEMEKIFGRADTTLKEILAYHKISKPRVYKKISDYTNAQLTIIKKHYESSTLIKSQEESSALTKTMVDAVNLQRGKENKEPATINAIRCYLNQVSDLNLQWGWPRNKKNQSEEEKLTYELPSGKSPKDEVLEALESIKKQIHVLTLISEIPGTTLDEPLVLPTAPVSHQWYGNQPIFYFINAPLIGLLSNKNDEQNPFRNAIRLAETVKAPWLIITGNLIHLDVTQASKNQGFRAMVSDTQDMEKNGSIELFQTMEERIQKRIKRVKELISENGKPIFSGNLYFTFGKTEMDIVNYWVAEEARLVTEQQRDIVKNGIKEIKKDIIKLEKIISQKRRNDEDPEEARLLLEVRYQELEFLTKKQAAVRQTNLNEVVRKKWVLNFCRKLAKIFEEKLPNFKVIATGDVYVKTGDKTAKIICNDKNSENDTFMDKLWVKINNDLHNGNRQPDFVFVGGFNLTYERYDSVYPARDFSDSRQTTLVEIVQLPMCVDSEYLKRNLEHTVNIGPFVTRLAANPFFASGIVFYGQISNFPVRDFAALDTLTDEKFFSNKTTLKKLFEGKYLAFGEIHSDQQEGSRYQAWYEISEPFSMPPPYVFHHQAFLNWNAPISWNANLGDICQGENFDKYHLEDPEGYMHAYDVEKRIEALFVNPVINPEALIKQRNELIKLWYQNSKDAGVTRVDKQLESYWQRAYEDQSEYYFKIIQHADKIGLAAIGKLGIISKISGNHFQNTPGVGSHFDEAVLCAKKLIEVLSRKHGLNSDMLKKRVQAPRGSGENVSILAGGLGLLNSKDYENWKKDPQNVPNEKFPYCISAKHKPGKGGARKVNPIVAMRRVRSLKGTTDPIYQDRFVIELAGHIDRDAEALLPNGLCKLVPCDGEFQTPFAQELDFSLGDIGTSILGLPMHRRGFFRLISFSYEGFRRYIKNGQKNVDVAKLFRNAL